MLLYSRYMYPALISILLSITPALLVLVHYIQPIESVAGTIPTQTQLKRGLHDYNHHKVVHRRNGITW